MPEGRDPKGRGVRTGKSLWARGRGGFMEKIMGVAGKSSDELLKSLPDWKKTDFIDFWKVGWRAGSKQQAVVAWDRAIKDRERSLEVLAAAKRYKKLCEKNDTPLTMAATWLNQARWETVPAVKEKEERVGQACSCGAEARHPTGECDPCHADKYSEQFFEGEFYPYKILLAKQLKDMGLTFLDGETRSDFSQRCREEFNRRQRGSVLLKKS